jgi:hypothetical protein
MNAAIEIGAAANPGAAADVPEEERVEQAKLDRDYHALIERLSRQSVVKHFDAYADIAWDDPEMRVDPSDPRWELSADEPLGMTAWYRSQPQAVRSAIGLHMIATFAKIGLQFESVLKRGLLEFAETLPNRSPEFRYVYHEVIEEAQHSLMFQELVNRTGFDIPGLPAWMRLAARQVVRLGRQFPELFFMFVLGGEDPIDHVQRVMLRQKETMHPLLRRVSQIHVTEEARHLSFARHYLKRNVPKLGPLKRFLLRLRTPLILGQMSRLMMQPSRQIVAAYGIPPEVMDEAYRRNPVHRQRKVEALAKVRALCEEIGVASPGFVPLWRTFGLWPESATAA